jgi:hypothetical protein
VPIKSYKVGPGLLTFGSAGTPTDATAQVTSATVSWSEDVEDDIPTLSGETLAGAANYTATLGGTFLQDITETGLVAFTWTNKGTVLPFTYTPNNDEGASINGQVRIAPLSVGGDVRSQPTSDFEWACIGEPTLDHGLV